MYKKIEIIDFRLFQNQTIFLGRYLTVLSGRNSTGKSTILGMIANSGELKKKDGLTYSLRQFRAEFSELFKGSHQFDRTGANKFTITLCDEEGTDIDYRSFRTAWQRKNHPPKKSRESESGKASSSSPSKLIDKEKTNSKSRFRVIPFKKLDNGKKTEAKFSYPVLYLGLSRLFPIGESLDDSISAKGVNFKSDEHKRWFIENYTSILSMQNEVKEITNYSLTEIDKKSGIGVSTDLYDYLTNSSGQDNLGQILLAILSFKKLKEDQGDQWKGGILLIDEVDATLHPAAQNKLLKLFLKEARSTGIQIIVTTHSLNLLKEISFKIIHNRPNTPINNTIELYYLTNANRRLEVKHNPAFTEIESDLTISSFVQNRAKIKLYSEDEEARWLLSKIIPEYLSYVEVLDVNIGCSELISLYNADLQYFGNQILVFDGDVTEGLLKKIPERTRQNLGNIVLLPGKKRPEEVIYEYIISLDPDHDYWTGGAQNLGFSWDYFKDHNPRSDEYDQKTERERFKQWFKDHKDGFESSHLIDYWINDNDDLVTSFKKSFKTAYNCIAKRMMTYTIQ